MTFAGVLTFLTSLLAAIQKWIDRQTVKDAQDLGGHREREKHERENEDLRDLIRRANTDSVRDDDAFGPDETGDPVSRTKKG
jgi:hypothetical protein